MKSGHVSETMELLAPSDIEQKRRPRPQGGKVAHSGGTETGTADPRRLVLDRKEASSSVRRNLRELARRPPSGTSFFCERERALAVCPGCSELSLF